MKIIYEDEAILVLFKEAGLAVQSAGRQQDLESVLRLRLSEKNIPYQNLHVIHRLDQPVEGLVLFALTKDAAAHLTRQMTQGTVEKRYLALVGPSCEEGKLLLGKAACGEEILLENCLLQDRKTNTSRIVPEGTPGEKKARLSFTATETFGEADAALLDIRLMTGRHHQIRVQLAGAGVPIIGDKKYGPAADGSGNERFPLLCAAGLSFVHPLSGERVHFELEPEKTGPGRAASALRLE